MDAPVDPKLLAWRHDGIDPEPGLLLMELTTAMLSVRTSLLVDPARLNLAAHMLSNLPCQLLPGALQRGILKAILRRRKLRPWRECNV